MSIIGSGTMVADGLHIMNADVSTTSFRVSPVYIGGNSFFGNNIAYPAGGRVGDNCLIATKAMIPLDGKVREGVGLLGSPPFEIPRTVERDQAFDHLNEGRRSCAPGCARRTGTTCGRWASSCSARWLHLFLITVFALAAFDAYGGFAQLEMAVLLALSILITPGLLRARRARPHAVAAGWSRSTARYMTRISGGTSASGRYRERGTCTCSTARRSRA